VYTVEDWGNFGRPLALLIVTAALAACGGGSSGSSANLSAPGSSTSPGSTIIFAQPQETGITGNLFVPNATHTTPPDGAFELVFWQTNPGNPDGLLIPTTWNAGAQTGFTPSSPAGAQLGFQNAPGTTTAQMEGGTVGAFLDSADLPGSPDGQKMMITPRYSFAPGSEPVPFASPNSALNASLDLQVPTAVGSSTYVLADFLFEDPAGVQISYGVALFSNGALNPKVGSGYDAPGKDYMLSSPLGIDQQFVTMSPGSAPWTDTPWQGWQHFAWSISQAQFAAGIAFLAGQFPEQVRTSDPTLYKLTKVHLNAEFRFQPEPAELGWSMQGWTVWLTESGG
jgi:hypothetical protein